MSAVPLLELEDVVVRYRRGRRTLTAVDGVSLDVAPGETVGLVGESGSGKSSIARAALGLAPVASGTVRFAGADVTHLPFKRRRELYRQVQVVFQDPYGSLNPSRTIGQTLAEPLLAHGERDRRAVRERVDGMLARVGLPADAHDRYPGAFSGGQRQRIAIIRALMVQPQLVICDEAVSALDLSVQAQILNLLKHLQRERGLSYLFISHDIDVVRHMCDRIVVLNQGKVIESGPAARVSAMPAHPYTRALLDASPVPDPARQRRRHAPSADLLHLPKPQEVSR
jgi:ABC-type glutathione transport system ATPase component